MKNEHTAGNQPCFSAAAPALAVWYGPMPESNGKSNYTAILHRKDAIGLDLFGGFTIARSEYPERVRYEADCVRYLIGEVEKKPFILDYDADKHSGYVTPISAFERQPHTNAPAERDAARDVLAERRRQVEAEGYDQEHDDAHPNEEIAAYAALYAMPPTARDWPASETGYGETFGAALCPVDWTPKFGDRRRELVKAAALLLAEIERIDRAAESGNNINKVEKCTVPPIGWRCRRVAGHEGPCAAYEGDV